MPSEVGKRSYETNFKSKHSRYFSQDSSNFPRMKALSILLTIACHDRQVHRAASNEDGDREAKMRSKISKGSFEKPPELPGCCAKYNAVEGKGSWKASKRAPVGTSS